MIPELLTYSVLGSCVTRDAADLGKEPLPAPVRYYSRTRVSSIVSKPTPIDPGQIRLDSAFQRRVVADDHNKNPAQVLPTLDHPLVIDLIDERWPLLRSPFGLVTASHYFTQAALRDQGDYADEPDDRQLADGGPFAEACERLAPLLPQQPIVVHEAYWAYHDLHGSDAGDPARADRANRWLKRAYVLLAAAIGDRARIVGPDPDLRRADPGHRWGLAPFHYIPEYYDELSVQVRAALSDHTT